MLHICFLMAFFSTAPVGLQIWSSNLAIMFRNIISDLLRLSQISQNVLSLDAIFESFFTFFSEGLLTTKHLAIVSNPSQ